jgi:hypothetical protein
VDSMNEENCLCGEIALGCKGMGHYGPFPTTVCFFLHFILYYIDYLKDQLPVDLVNEEG